MAHRRVRPTTGATGEGHGARLAEVLAGVAHHGRADAAFHASVGFRDAECAMSRALASVGAPRLSLFGHIAWELCLDGALVRREGQSLLASIDEGVGRATELADGESAARAAARVHHAARTGEPLPAEFDARFARILRELSVGSWIEGYARGEVIAERLEGIRRHLGLAALDAVHRAALATRLDDALARAEGALDTVLAMEV
jgi:hypothetical protein